jgi:hypothetical protein
MTKISNTPEFEGNLQDNDLLLGVDFSDKSQADTGTTKKVPGSSIKRLKPENNLSDLSNTAQAVENLFEPGTANPGDTLTSDGLDVYWSSSTVAEHASSHEFGGSDTLDHDQLLGYNANEHIDHSTISVIAGTGLSGGGTLAASRTLTVNAELAANQPLTILSTASRTLSLSDSNTVIRCSDDDSTTIDIPSEAAVNFPIGTTIKIYRTYDSGVVTISCPDGVYLNGEDSPIYSLPNPITQAIIIKTGSDAWDILGDAEELGLWGWYSFAASEGGEGVAYATSGGFLTDIYNVASGGGPDFSVITGSGVIDVDGSGNTFLNSSTVRAQTTSSVELKKYTAITLAKFDVTGDMIFARFSGDPLYTFSRGSNGMYTSGVSVASLFDPSSANLDVYAVRRSDDNSLKYRDDGNLEELDLGNKQFSPASTNMYLFGTSSHNFQGDFYELRVWDGPLSNAKVLAECNKLVAKYSSILP